MSVDELCYLTAAQAIGKFTDGSLSPVELMQAIASRSDAVEPAVNAFTETFFEDALVQARQAEARYRNRRARRRGRASRAQPRRSVGQDHPRSDESSRPA